MRKEEVSKEIFKKGIEMHMPFGGIITPIIRLPTSYKTAEAERKISDYLANARWANCKFQKSCLNAVQKVDCAGFSCEECPLNGKVENMMK